MNNFYEFLILTLILIVVVNIVASLAVIWELITGSYKKYIEKRERHLEQLHRIEQNLRLGGKND